MRQDFEKLFSYLEPVEPPAGLFDRIITAIQKEEVLQRKRQLALLIIGFSIFSLGAMPFSWMLLQEQLASSGFLYFLSTGFGSFTVLSSAWYDFGLALVESLPVFAVLAFLINTLIVVFIFRLIIRLSPAFIYRSIVTN